MLYPKNFLLEFLQEENALYILPEKIAVEDGFCLNL